MSTIARVLIIDDQTVCTEVIADTLRYSLGDQGCEILLEQRKDRAITRLPEFRPDLVTTDLTPDGADAFDVIRATKALGKDIGVIVISGTFTAQSRQEARRLGADHCFDKPFDVPLFISAVEKLLEQRRRTSKL